MSFYSFVLRGIDNSVPVLCAVVLFISAHLVTASILLILDMGDLLLISLLRGQKEGKRGGSHYVELISSKRKKR
jgi:hypothetical protein